MKLRLFANAMCLCLLLAPVAAFAGSPEKAARLLVVMQAERNMGNVLSITVTAMKKGMLEQCEKKADAPVGCAEAMPRVSEFLAQRMGQVLDWSALEPELRRAYADTLSDGEMDAAIAFYTSPEGQAFLKKLPQLMQQGALIGQKHMEAAMPAIQTDLKALFDQIARDNSPAAKEQADAAKTAAEASRAARDGVEPDNEKPSN